MVDLFAAIIFSVDSVTALYALFIGVLILSGVFLPVPEEATLIFGGYLAYSGVVELWPIIYVLTAGIVLADIAGYCFGRFGGDWIAEKIFSRFNLTKLVLDRTMHYFERFGAGVVIFTRPFLGIRVAVPILAGHARMNFAKFIFCDMLGAIPWTFFLVFLSYSVGSGLDLLTEIKEIKHAIYIILGIGIAVYASIKINSGKLSLQSNDGQSSD